MDLLTDRTAEVEERLKSIRVDAQDGCSFWTPREDSFVCVRQCWYCLYGQFTGGSIGGGQKGLCKFKL